MRLTPTLFLFLSACTGASGSLIPVKAVGSADGTLTGPQVFIGGVPVNALVKVHGTFTYTVQPMPPYLTYDGNYDIVVEPIPGREAEAIQAVTSGAILIRRNGVPGALNKPGTWVEYQAGLLKAYKAAHPDPLPEVPPPSKPVASSEAEGECPNGVCSIPR